MKNELSILIPVYNDVCTDIVSKLLSLCKRRAQRQTSFLYEIIVADDASPIHSTTEANAAINNMDNCRFVVKEQNSGSAATRNFLAWESKYEWLLFLDCDMQIADEDFIDRYMDDDHQGVVNGGIAIGQGPKGNLRFRYEKACEEQHTADRRQARPYQSFRSTNFLIERNVMLSNPFDERFQKSGYEDVMFGKQLKDAHIPVTHIDNPTLMVDFEENTAYMDKIDRSLLTLCRFRSELRGFSKIITAEENVHLGIVKYIVRLWHRLFGSIERRNLCGQHPHLKVFNIYRLGYYFILSNNLK